MSAREEILDRIRAALSDQPAVPPVPRNYRQTTGLDAQALVELLVDRLVDYKANVFVEEPDGVSGRIGELLAGAGRFVIPPGLPVGWLAFDAEPARAVVDHPDHPLTVGELDAMDAVLTCSAVAVAETGTIVLDGSADQGRRAISLVPDHHICVVPVKSIVGILPEALQRLDGTRPLTLISGPSATSDIELERVEGVHGPRRLDVIIAV
ncbi:LutC/YkgG family protein [Arthrobacter sp. H14-L1]|uniref:LutC/YkgG family protein n=1 Tax=Arthrobacter sp. H14-L1 TaxID=2996697 RepID=UPI00227162C1|nr:lactate utilization protein C [Arthrobacter sp. H14-L1]MCY0904191.1 lactate utilization protein C [Arthrobacter sp. H14-L1]